MKRDFIQFSNISLTNKNDIDPLLNWKQCFNRDVNTDELRAKENLDLSGETVLETKENTRSDFDAKRSNSDSNTAVEQILSLNFPTFEEFMQQIKNSPTAYTTSTTSKASSNNNFSIEVKFGAGTTNFTNVMKAAIEDAAEIWEDAILQSNFSDGHTLTIEVKGENFGADSFEAKASPEAKTLRQDSDGNLLPTEGNSTVNTNNKMMKKFANNREYFTNLIAHEFGHVMGIGTLWKINDLIDTRLGGYRADTQAGNVYNTNRKIKTNIPLTTGQGKGSDNLHWREEIFDNELMTHAGESIGSSEPLSIMTLASLEDLGWNVDYSTADIFPDAQTYFA